MLPVLTPSEASALDAAAAARGISTHSLMERAGYAVAVEAARVAGGRTGRRVLVVAGKGNNGGDGTVAARVMSGWGMGAVLITMLNTDRVNKRFGGGPAADNLLRLMEETAVPVHPYAPERLERELARADVVIDAIFGTGFHGVPEGIFGSAIAQLATTEVPVVAVDIPSGVDGATGRVEGAAMRASATVSLAALKPGVILPPGWTYAGELTVADIGFPPELIGSDTAVVEVADVASRLPQREADTHKQASGVVMVVGGSRSMTGAVCLMAEAAARVGAGLVIVATPESVMPVVQGVVTEAVFLPLPETEEGTVSHAALDHLLQRMENADAAAIGPGMTTEAETQHLVRGFAAESPKPFVLDADGIGAFAGRAGELSGRKSDAVLTPHLGEFERLSGLAAEDVTADRLGAVRHIARETGAALLLKGSRTVIASPEGEMRVNPTGTSVLATAGSGDVLTGMTAGLAARGLVPFEAATVAAYLHGVAGRIAGERTGEGTTARDVLAAVPSAVTRVRGEADA
ncbi:MAG: NAD(P)H-hydrate dehydratase [Actinomycetota bacterium]|nr:NAD(P)H-hydrate dehydratase [Actinomycetota bacterium]